jgi:two-component system cell cycle response regulator DivK
MAVEERPDLILMDVQLPGLDGVSALALLRSHPRSADIPVVAVTAFALQSEQAYFLRAGFNACVTKPIHIKDFSKRIRDVLDNRRLRA